MSEDPPTAPDTEQVTLVRADGGRNSRCVDTDTERTEGN